MELLTINPENRTEIIRKKMILHILWLHKQAYKEFPKEKETQALFVMSADKLMRRIWGLEEIITTQEVKDATVFKQMDTVKKALA